MCKNTVDVIVYIIEKPYDGKLSHITLIINLVSEPDHVVISRVFHSSKNQTSSIFITRSPSSHRSHNVISCRELSFFHGGKDQTLFHLHQASIFIMSSCSCFEFGEGLAEKKFPELVAGVTPLFNYWLVVGVLLSTKRGYVYPCGNTSLFIHAFAWFSCLSLR